MRSERAETKPPEKREPELSSKSAPNKKVLDVLLLLVTKQTSGWMGETSPSKSVGSPATLWAASHMNKW